MSVTFATDHQSDMPMPEHFVALGISIDAVNGFELYFSQRKTAPRILIQIGRFVSVRHRLRRPVIKK